MKHQFLAIILSLASMGAMAQQNCSSALTIAPSNSCSYTSHTTNGTEYWLKFTATSKNVNISLVTTQFGTNATHIHNLQLLDGTCSNQTIIAEDELPFENTRDRLAIDLDASSLTIGNTYYIRAERQATIGTCDKLTCRASNSTSPTTFQLCVENINVILPLDFGLEPPLSSRAYVTNRGQLRDINGQSVPDVKLYTLHTNPAVFIADSYTSFVFQKSDSSANTPDSLHRVDMSLVGANHGRRIFKAEQNTGITNFFYPHTPSGITGNKSYSRSVCNEVYPFIDMQFYSNREGVKFYFIVKPGGNADDIILRFDGASSINVMPGGGLKVNTSLGTMEYEVPHAYQVNGGSQVVPMPWQAEFIQLSSNTVKFDIRNYPANMPLFIQVDQGHSQAPQHINTPEWSMYFGGNGYDEGTGVTTDTDGNPYFTGFTSSNGFPPLAGGQQGSFEGVFDAYIAKFGSASGASTGFVPNADKLQWATYYGGSGDDRGLGITTAGNGTSGRVYVTGYTESSNLLTYNNAGIYNQNALTGTRDAFIIGLDNFSGGQNQSNRWATYFGGNGIDMGNSITKDATGNIYIGGSSSTNFYSANTCVAPTDGGFPQCNTSGVYNNGNAYGGGLADGFVAKFDNTSQLTWSSFYGGGNEDAINGIALDPTGNLWVTGKTASSADFPIAASGSQYNQNFGGGSFDAFVTKFSSAGSLLYSSFFGGSGDDIGFSIAIDGLSNVYFAGQTSSSTPACVSCVCTTPGAGEFPLCNQTGAYFQGSGSSGSYGGGPTDGFIAKFDNAASFRWGTYYGGNSSDVIKGLTTDYLDQVYFTGQTSSASPVANLYKFGNAWDHNQNTLSGPSDAILGYFDASNVRKYSTYYSNIAGATLDEASNSIAVFATGGSNHHWYITGLTNTGPTGFYTMFGFNCCPNGYNQPNNGGGTDAFVARFSMNAMWMDVEDLSSSKADEVIVFPNPSSHAITVQFTLDLMENVSMEIFSITGQRLKTVATQKQTGAVSQIVDFSDFSNGIYLLQIKIGNRLASKKIIKHD